MNIDLNNVVAIYAKMSRACEMIAEPMAQLLMSKLEPGPFPASPNVEFVSILVGSRQTQFVVKVTYGGHEDESVFQVPNAVIAAKMELIP